MLNVYGYVKANMTLWGESAVNYLLFIEPGSISSNIYNSINKLSNSIQLQKLNMTIINNNLQLILYKSYSFNGE